MIASSLSSRRPWSAGGRILAAALLFVLAALPCLAQAPATTDREIGALIARIEDPDKRAILLGDLRALLELTREAEAAEAPPQGAQFLRRVSDRIGEAGAAFAAGVGAVADFGRHADWAAAELSDPGRREFWLVLAAKVAAVLAAGALAEGVVARLLARPRRHLAGRPARGPASALPLLIAIAALDLPPIAAFLAASYFALTIAEPAPQAGLALLALVNAHAVSAVLTSLARALFAPMAPQLRLFALADHAAAYLFVWFRRFIVVGVYGYFLAQLSAALGAPDAAHGALSKGLGFAVLVMGLIFVLQNRSLVADALRRSSFGGQARSASLRSAANRMADVWHLLVAAYVSVAYLIWAADPLGGFAFLVRATLASVAICIAAGLALALSVRALRRLFRILPELGERFPALEERANRYQPAVARTVQAAIVAAAALALLQAWGVGVADALGSETARFALGRAFNIALVLAVAFLVWEIATAFIQRALDRRDAQGVRVQAGQRLRTLLPLARTVLLIVILVMTALTALSELGVNIAPLLAGAGVVGLAVGFGAQTLVKDVITGAFILFEDLIAVGDIATVGGQTGVVEALSIRTIRLRDVSGVLHVIPFGAVDQISNHSKVFSYALIDAGVAYRENTDEVGEILRAVGAEIEADPAWRADVLAPIEVMGVQELADSAVIVRARIKTAPGRHIAVRREFNRRMKMAFDAQGVEIPFPHRTVYFGEDKRGAAPALRVSLRDEGRPAGDSPPSKEAPPRT